jgi:hypothetical protein
METVENERRMSKVESDLANIKELLLEIKEDIKSQPYVPRAEINLMFKSVNDRIDAFENDHKESRTAFIAWVGIALSFLSVISAFIALYHK